MLFLFSASLYGQIEGDLNHNGVVSVSDVTYLCNLILQKGGEDVTEQILSRLDSIEKRLGIEYPYFFYRQEDITMTEIDITDIWYGDYNYGVIILSYNITDKNGDKPEVGKYGFLMSGLIRSKEEENPTLETGKILSINKGYNFTYNKGDIGETFYVRNFFQLNSGVYYGATKKVTIK